MTIPPSPSSFSRPHVLIVSDDLDLVTFLSEGLTLGGFWTSTVASAIQTLELFRLRSFDLILLDDGLAGLGALELARRLRHDSPSDSSATPRTTVPILLIVGQTAPPDAVDVAAAGINEMRAAPFELGELLSQMNATLGRPHSPELG